jgi:hypothetical protein
VVDGLNPFRFRANRPRLWLRQDILADGDWDATGSAHLGNAGLFSGGQFDAPRIATSQQPERVIALRFLHYCGEVERVAGAGEVTKPYARKPQELHLPDFSGVCVWSIGQKRA